jgi:hypothetical protein
MAVTRSPLGQLVHLVDVAAPGLLEPLGQQRDPADRGEPPDRRPGRGGVGDRALVAPELLGVPLQLDPHGLAVREVQPAVGEADPDAGAVPAGRMARSDSQVASGNACSRCSRIRAQGARCLNQPREAHHLARPHLSPKGPA